mgnify:CR=1 FL=1
MFRKTLDYAEAGDNVGVLLRGVQRNEIQRGQVLAKPGTIHPHTSSVVRFTFLQRTRVAVILHSSTTTVHSSTSEQLTLQVQSHSQSTEMCMPGDNVEMDVELITPIAIEVGLRFAIREGGRTVGSGAVIAINE